jgi:ABC-2 type transport system permease protein
MTTGLLAPRTPATATAGTGSELAGTLRLLRLAARRDRLLLPAWLLALGVLLAASAASVVGLYGTAAEREQYALVAATNLVARAFSGPMAGTALGAIVMTETFALLAVLVSIMSVQAVVRHTRLEEETGRAELIGSAVVGRHAPLTAALVLTFAVNTVVAAVTAAILVASDLPVAGSVLAALVLMGVGWSFAGVAAVTAQVSSSARGANGLGGAAVGIAFFLRALGDSLGEATDGGVEVTSAWPSWLSPIGWGQQGRPFGGDHWGILALFAMFVLVAVVTAFALRRHRDVGVGMRPVPAGPSTASARLRSPLGLAWRLQRGPVIGWTSGLVAWALAFGAIGDEVDTWLESSAELAELFTQLGDSGVLVDLYIVFMMGLLAVAVGAFAVQGVLRLRTEELAGRAEPLLATAVERHRWVASHLAVAMVGSTGMLLAVGLAGGSAYGLATGTWGARFGEWVLAAVVGVPAVLVLAGLVVAAVGLAPRWAAVIGWGVLGISLVMGQLGALLELPQWVLNLSPFTHVPPVPAEELEVLPIVWLLALALALTTLGLVALRRRDLVTS